MVYPRRSSCVTAEAGYLAGVDMDTGDKQQELLHKKTILSDAPANDLINAGRDLGTG